MKHKIKEWVQRYLPAEIVATVGALTFASVSYNITGNGIISAYMGTIGENIGYYGYITLKDINHSKKHHEKNNKKYGIVSFLKNIRNLILEFGFSEFLDSFFVRPFCMYVFPIIIGNYITGIIIGKIVADIVFYVPTIIAYELRKKHISP